MIRKKTSVTGRHNPPRFHLHLPVSSSSWLPHQARIVQGASTAHSTRIGRLGLVVFALLFPLLVLCQIDGQDGGQQEQIVLARCNVDPIGIGVLPLTLVDNLAISPTRLTAWGPRLILASQ